MREIKFRGRWKDTGKVIPDFNEDYTIDACNSDIFIVEQFTGLKDRNDVEIFEGDIFKFGIYQYLIVFNNGGFGYKTPDKFVGFSEIKDLKYFFSEMEVIGNIHKNSELLVR